MQKPVLGLALTTALTAITCAPRAYAADARVSFDSNVKVSVLTKDGLSQDERIDAGKEVALKGNTVYWISSSGKVPLLVVPQAPSDVEAPSKLVLPNVIDWPSEVSSQQLQSKLASLLDEMYRFQTALAKKDTTEAEKILGRMENVQPMDYYSFLRASLAFVKGDMKTAKDQVQRGLKRYPENEEGKRLLKTLEAQP